MQYLRVKNFDQFQHYKDRSPPWIKLHNSVLEDYEFSCLQDASKLHLVLIWLLASRLDNRIPNDPGWVARKINATDPVDLNQLIERGFLVMEHDASKPLANRLHSARPEGETEGETEGEQKRRVPRFTPPTVDEVREYVTERGSSVDPSRFHDFYTANGWVQGKGKPVKDWKACVRTWERQDGHHSGIPTDPNGAAYQ